MDQIKFGIIGTGRIIAKFCRAFNQGLVSGGSVLAVASRDINRAKESAAANGISRAYGSYEELLEDRDIDIVYIAVTNEMHFSCCEMAIRAGKHIICEKPLTTCAADARKLAALAKDAGVFLMEAMWTCFLPAVRKAQEWIKEGRIGEPCSMRASLCAHREPAEYPRLYDPDKGAGTALDLGIYCLQLAGFFAGDRSLLDCKSIVIPGECGVDITDFILLEYTGGFTADLSCSINFFAVNEAYIFGETGCIRIAPWFNAAESSELFTLIGADGAVLREPLPAEKFNAASGFEFEIIHALECVRGGKLQSDVVPLSKTIEAMEIIDRVRASALLPGQSAPR